MGMKETQGSMADNSVVDAYAAKEVESPSVVDKNVEKEKQSCLVDTTGLGSYPPLPTQETTTAGNAPGKSSYANVTGKPSGKKVNFRTLFTPKGNGNDVVVPLESIRAISERFSNTAYGFFLGKLVAYPVVANYVKLYGVPVTTFNEDGLSAIATKLGTPLMLDSYTSDMCMQSWGRSSYARVMIELRADVELKDNIMAAMPKITGEGYYTCNIRVEYEWKPPRCACCKVFGHVQEECPKNIGTGETNNLKKTSQTPKGIPVGQMMRFKPTKQVYQPVSEKPTVNTSVNKKKNVEHAKEVTTNSSGSSFWNVDASSPSTTPILEKIYKIEKLIIDGKVTLVDDEGKPLEKVAYLSDYDSEDEVASVDNEMANFLAKKDGYGHDIPDKLQAICNKLDITVRGRRKK
ncbi:retrotransposon protein, putative, ty1-copia subclass [Tanacetum coccineum]